MISVSTPASTRVRTALVAVGFVVSTRSVARETFSCGEESVAYERMEELFRQLALELCKADRRLLARELAWLRKYVGASGRDWAAFIDRSPETLSRWENGKEGYPLGFERLLRLAAKNGPMEWDYTRKLRGPVADEPRLEMKQHSAGGRWVRASGRRARDPITPAKRRIRLR